MAPSASVGSRHIFFAKLRMRLAVGRWCGVCGTNPSPVASLREAPPSPTGGEGRKIDISPDMTASRIHRLTLTHFRNYRAASLETRGDVVVLVGPNGAGKTNCIEAISFLSPGRGLRRATLDDVADNEGDGSWAVSAEVEGALYVLMPMRV